MWYVDGVGLVKTPRGLTLNGVQHPRNIFTQWTKAELAAISAKVAAENGEQRALSAAVLPHEVSLVRDLLLLVPSIDLQQACVAHGIASDDVVARTNALIAKIEAQAVVADGEHKSQLPLALGERPAGTAHAVATMVAECHAELEMDDDMLNDIAEAAVGEDAGADEVSRAQRVAAAKARLKSNRGDLAKKLVSKRISK